MTKIVKPTIVKNESTDSLLDFEQLEKQLLDKNNLS